MKKYLFLLVFWGGFLSTGMSQDILEQKVSIRFEDLSLEDALFQLVDQTQIHLSFSSDILPDKNIKRSFRRTPIRQILLYLLGGTSIEFQPIGNQIVLYLNGKAPQEKKYTISGFLQEEETGEFIISAYVKDKKSNQTTYTNEYGFYSLTLAAGAVDLSFSYLGYELKNYSFYLDRNLRLNLKLKTALTLEEIVVYPNDSTLSQNNNGTSIDYLELADIKSIPSLAGEPDVIRTSHLLPGVQTGTDGIGGIFVRGGNAGHNLILIDGVPVYNVSHAAGLFSIFNTNAIRSAKLMKGGFPARYGGRLSSILDIRTKEGNMERFKGAIETGLLTGRATLEGPLIKGKSSFFFSGRHSFLNWYIDRQAKRYKEDRGEKGTSSYKFYDLNFKINYTFSEKDKLYLSYYQGGDAFLNDGKASDVIGLYDTDIQIFKYYRFDQGYSEGLDWGNKVGAMRWNHLFNSKLFANTTLTYSNLNLRANYYTSDSLLLLQPIQATLTRSMDIGRYQSSIEDLGGKIDFNWIPSTHHNVRFGGSLTRHNFRPGALSLGQNLSDQEVERSLSNDSISSQEYALYIEDDFTLAPNLFFNLGVHSAFLDVGNRFYASIQPRFSIYWQWSSRLGLKLSTGRMTQFLHLLSSSSIGLPTDLWVPSTNNIRPEQAWQITGGFDYSLGKKKQFKLEVEAYYKKMNHLLSFSEGASFLNNWQENVTSGSGDAYGLELLLSKKQGNTRGWLAYTLAWTNRQFDLINQGQVYPFRYDRRHNLKGVLTHRFSKHFGFSANWIFSSGFAYSLALLEYEFQPSPTQNPVKVLDYGEKNQYRMPYYHRLDLGINVDLVSTDRKLRHQFYVGAYNVYDRNNPLYYRLQSKFVQKGNSLREIKEVVEVQMLPILPSFSYSLKF